MTAAALAYAALGWRILPCEPGGKRPIIEGWPRRATTNPDLLRRWFGRSPGANVAVATGAASGLFALDVDGPEGERALVALERAHVYLPARYMMQWTGGGRGGWQALFAWPEGRPIRNSAGRLGAKLDTRGEGGYVVLPPSVTSEAYHWAEERDPWSLPAEAAPAWLIELCHPAPAPPPAPQRGTFRPAVGAARPGASDRYALKALEAELALVALAPVGGKNDQIWSSACSLFRLVRDGRLHADIVERGLVAAARHSGCGTDPLCREKCRRGCRAQDAIARAAQKRGCLL